MNSLLFLQNELEEKGTIIDLAELSLYMVTNVSKSDIESRTLIFEAIENLINRLRKQDDEIEVTKKQITGYYDVKEIQASHKFLGVSHQP